MYDYGVKKINRWDSLPYPNSNVTPIGQNPYGGTWPLNYFKRARGGGFLDSKGNRIDFDIKAADESDKFSTTELKNVILISKALTENQKEVARYWGKGVLQNKFLPIVQCLINQYEVDVLRSNRIHNILAKSINDALIICWYYKYLYQIPRPVQYDTTFKPLLDTPYHPSYPAGHAVGAGCLDGVLSYFFPGAKERIKELCEECSISRLYAGVHYSRDLIEGYSLGLDIANKIIEEIKHDGDRYGASIDKRYEAPLKNSIMPPPYEQIDFCNNCTK